MLDREQTVVHAAASCLTEADPEKKVERTRETASRWSTGTIAAGAPTDWEPVEQPGRPSRPALVPARKLPKRKLTTPQGLASLVHAVAHIEFNAINLAWDAVQRFPRMPPEYQGDWVKVAAEEAEHFAMMRERLNQLGYDYGDMPAHDGLWEMAQRTAGDVLERMALVPRVLEARGLDVTPGMITRLREVGDHGTADRLEIILRDEVGHVAIGNRWFHSLCAERRIDPMDTFATLLRQHLKGQICCPLNQEARLRAGFVSEELAALIAMCNQT
jgi:uncharacterized ferritin-like protein (DUF455 family)